MGARLRSLRYAAVAGALIAWAPVGCGHDHPPLAGDPLGEAGPPGTDFDFDASIAPPKCEVATPDGGVCGCTDVPLVTDAPTLYLVLDRSGSMTEQNKWKTVQSVVVKLVKSIGARASFGAAVFPDPRFDDCAPGIQVMAPRRGDSPPGSAGYTTVALEGALNLTANGGTPTAATLRNLLPKLTGFSTRTFVILATDGGPNCNGVAQCDNATCIPNIESAPGCSVSSGPNCCDANNYGPGSCLDEQPTIDAVAALHTAGVDTYVVGVPGSAPYAAVLDKLATAGNTARASEPLYYAVDTADETALLTALSQIAAKIIASCTLPLNGTPADPNLVNVFIDEQPVARDPVNGWTLDGATVTLVGTTCDRVLSGSALDVRVIEGCPTIGPK